MADALSDATVRLKQITDTHGPDAVAVAGSTRVSLETQAAAVHLCREMAYRGPAFWMTTDHATSGSAAAQRLKADMAISLKELESADGVLVIAADPVNDAPMLEMALRQAWRNDAWVAVFDPRPVSLSFPAEHVAAGPQDLQGYLEHVMAVFMGDRRDTTPDGIDPKTRKQLESIARLLNQCIRPAIVCGTDHGDATLVNLAADLAGALRATGKPSGLFYLMAGPNGLSAAMHAGEPPDLQQLLSLIEQGSIRALVLSESDPFLAYPNRKRLTGCLEKLDLLVVMDYLNTPASTAAHIFLPTTTIYESGGAYMNQEGRIQRAAPVYGGGLSVLGEAGGNHPPRVFRTDAPGTDLLPAWKILTALAAGGVLPERVPWPESDLPIFAFLAREPDIPAEGIRVLAERPASGQTRTEPPVELSEADPAPDCLTLMTVERTFGTEELSCRSAPLQELEESPAVLMHPGDAGAMGLDEGENVVIDTGAGEIRVRLAVSEDMARGVVFLPRHHRLDWQYLPNLRVPLPGNSIRRAEGGGS
ncbi:hypothetical protein D3OALGB2SA_3474 [Olavius algarvensis associated proteobacterium Delta 3]|nr:hypothetical protein D3OALGB2SA_3474 [Olavius algarvensis associated proteobacterium Delta 3]